MTRNIIYIYIYAAGVFILTLCSACFRNQSPVITENDFDSLQLAEFIEPNFPFVTIPLDLRNLGDAFPDTNHVARGLAIQLGNDAYACFDLDLLRWSVAWSGAFIPMVLPAHVSYQEFFAKNNNELPTILGQPAMATGIYPGWSIAQPSFDDVRPESQRIEGLSWGPIPAETGRWEGAFVHENRVLLSYRIGQTYLVEMPGSTRLDSNIVFTRTFRIGANSKPLFLNVAEVSNGQTVEKGDNYVHILQGEAELDSVSSVVVVGDEEIGVQVFNNRHLVVSVPPSGSEREFTVLISKYGASGRQRFVSSATKYSETFPVHYKKGSPTRWPQTVVTQGKLSSDTSAFVTDVLTLPLPNPWARNVRVADVAFYTDGRAAVSTYDGDVWIVSGITKDLHRLKWKRFASGFYEPMSIEVVEDIVYVYAKEGIVRLHDLNGDGEADYYENYSNIMNQSTGTREWAADMVADKNGDFFIAKGGHITGFKGILPLLTRGGKPTNWRASSAHSGTIMRISENGRHADVWASGLRMPYIGINRETNFLTASDQQGNFVPATPIYPVRRWDYFGVPLTLHRKDEPPVAKPITWIPHRVERSGISQTWVNSTEMGPLNGELVHFSFGRPGVFRVLLDSVDHVYQGGVTVVDAYHPAPVMKGEISTQDGLLYIAGFNNFASNSKGVSALTRLRYTGRPSYMASNVYSGHQGIVLSFDAPLDRASAAETSRYSVKQWNYKRSTAYGSGHYRSDGSPGEETIPVLAVNVSEDGHHVWLVVQDHKPIDQIEILYDVNFADGHSSQSGVWFTVNTASTLNLARWSFDHIVVNIDSLATEYQAASNANQIASAEHGKVLFQRLGCQGCHAIDPATDLGMYGPPVYGLAGKQRWFTDGSQTIAEDAYFRESIIEPGNRVVRGYGGEMPSYEGILSETDLTSIVLYLNTL